MIARRDFDRYCRQVDNLAEDARLMVMGMLEGGIADPGGVAATRDLAISALTDVLGTYAVASAAAAADFYERSGGSPAVLGDADLKAIEDTVRYQAGKLVDGDVEGFVDQVSEFAAHAVKLSANRQMIKNAEDGSRRRRRKRGKGPKVRFARVPTGPETCTFCTMLASRGFVYWSREDAGEFGHFHRKCDCKVVASTDAEGLEGYDPERYLELYREFSDIDADPSLTRAQAQEIKHKVLAAKGGPTLGLPPTEPVDGLRYDVSKDEDLAAFLGMAISAIRDEKVEHSYILQADGTVMHGIGTSSNVSVEGAEMTGAYVVHNHPPGEDAPTFSSDDFKVLCSHQDAAWFILLAEDKLYYMRAVREISESSYNYARGLVNFPETLEGKSCDQLTMEALRDLGYIEYRWSDL